MPTIGLPQRLEKVAGKVETARGEISDLRKSVARLTEQLIDLRGEVSLLRAQSPGGVPPSR